MRKIPASLVQQAWLGAIKLLFSSECMGISAAMFERADHLQRGRITLLTTTSRLVSRLFELIFAPPDPQHKTGPNEK